jgi:uncharacterized protein (TIGR03086 family)
MSEISDRYRKIAGQFTQTVESVPAGAWDNPAPCEGWVARDVVRHMVEWMPGFFQGRADLEFPAAPSVDDDPAAAWRALSDTLQAALDDPEVAARQVEMPMGTFRVDDAIAMICIGDILVHTWDVARATGLDESLDATEVHRMYDGIESMDEAMRNSGHYGPRVMVPDDADEQTKLIAFTGRRP